MKNRNIFQKYIDNVFVKNLLLITGTVFALLFFSGFITIYQTVQDDKFSAGVHIDGIDVSGMTYDEAEHVVLSNLEKLLSNMRISLVYAGETVELSAYDMGIAFKQEEALNEAYYYNKNINDSHGQRFDKTITLSGGMDFKTEFAIDENKLSAAITKYAERYYKDAQDATASFDKNTCKFSYTQEQPGTKIDTKELLIKIKEMLNNKDFSSLQVDSVLIPPFVTQNELKENTVFISGCETQAVYNENRNINIHLICKAVDGIEIKPGETLSLNELTGERTEKKGYRTAPAIIHGVLIDDVGGGVCQLTGTLYNAALLSNLEIVERVNHTWSSSYLPAGLDATINWNDKDLKIKNPFDYSVYISAKFKDQKVIVKIFGQPLKDGITIKIKNDIIKELPPSGTQMRYTSELPVGTRRIFRNRKAGFIVKVYRIYLKNGTETSRQLISCDTYPAMNRIVLVGTNNKDK